MKQIEGVTIWKNGKEKIASILNAIIVNDDLESSCSFYYQLCESGEGNEEYPLTIGSVLTDGNINLSGEDYLAWDGSNEGAYTFIANQLNLTIL